MLRPGAFTVRPFAPSTREPQPSFREPCGVGRAARRTGTLLGRGGGAGPWRSACMTRRRTSQLSIGRQCATR